MLTANAVELRSIRNVWSGMRAVEWERRRSDASGRKLGQKSSPSNRARKKERGGRKREKRGPHPGIVNERAQCHV